MNRAVVLGCGVAGVAAAAALRRSYDDVVIVEKDILPVQAEARPGVPQGTQLHNLLSRAQMHLEELLPGFCESLQEAGAGCARVSDETQVYELGLRMPERDLGLRLMCASRPVIEHVARSLLFNCRRGISLREGTRALGLELSRDGSVAGVMTQTAGRRASLPASIVVDATGSQSGALQWLRTVEREVPRVDTARVSQWYVSALFERPAEYVGINRFWLVFPTPPLTRGGLVSPVGDREWYVSLSGQRDDEPPRSADEMRSYASTLEVPWIADLLDGALIETTPSLFRRSVARWRRYDLLDEPIPGFLPLGDAIGSLNPLFGQGMSVAAWQAAELAAILGSVDEFDGPATRQYLRRARDACCAAWTLSGLIDPETAASEQPHVRTELFEALGRLLKEDQELHRRYVGVWHLVEPASALMAREFTARLAAAAE